MCHILVETELRTLGMSELYIGIWYVGKPEHQREALAAPKCSR